MSNLAITITQITENDYAGIPETTKSLKGSIDNKNLPIIHTEDSLVSDATCKTNFKNKLTSLGYTWTTES